MRQRRRLARRADRHQALGAFGDLPVDERAKGFLVEPPVLVERRHERGQRASQHDHPTPWQYEFCARSKVRGLLARRRAAHHMPLCGPGKGRPAIVLHRKSGATLTFRLRALHHGQSRFPPPPPLCICVWTGIEDDHAASPCGRRVLLAATFLAALPAAAAAQTGSTAYAPAPKARPQAAIDALDGGTTASVGKQDRLVPGASRGSVARLKAGLDALADGNVGGGAGGARQPARWLRSTATSSTWAIAMEGGQAVTSGDIADGRTGASGLARHGSAAQEQRTRAAAREPRAPRRRRGVRRHGCRRRPTAPSCLRARLWRSAIKTARAVLGALLAHRKARRGGRSDDHQGVRRHHSQGRPSHPHGTHALCRARHFGAKRVATLAGAKPLAEAWAAVIKGDPTAGKLLDAVPAAQRSAGYSVRRGTLPAPQGEVPQGGGDRAQGAERPRLADRSRRMVGRTARACRANLSTMAT